VLSTGLPPRAPQLLAEEGGFSLIELLVAMAAAVVVVFAVFTIQDVVLRQTSREFSQVDATQHVREALENLENELHSACLTDNVTPIQGGSTPSTLLFVSQFGTAATLTPVEHQIAFSSTGQTLIESTFAETGVTTSSSGLPVYTFSTTPSTTRTLLTNVKQSGTTPVFQYFAYQEPLNSSGQPYTDSAGDPYMMLLDGTGDIPGTGIIPPAQPLNASPSLSVSDSQNTSEVMITVSVGPSGGTGENTNLADTRDTVADGVVLRLTPAANHAGDGNVFLPCQ
jgi:hypothetical protein